MDITKIKSDIPKWVYDKLTPNFQTTYAIDSELRLAHFLAQCSYESATFTAVEEDLYYTKDRLKVVWPTIFTTDELAKKYEKNPEKLGNFVYANKNGNGNEASGDGYKFRGRGYIQLTGRNNYKAFDAKITEDCVKDPDIVATTYPLESAGFFFKSNNIHLLADAGSTEADSNAVTKKVNKYTTTGPDRFKLFSKFYKKLTSKSMFADDLEQELSDLKQMYAEVSLELYRLKKQMNP